MSYNKKNISKDEPTTDPNWAEASINYLDNMVATEGPFYGLLGFSQAGVGINSRDFRKWDWY